MLLKKPDNRKFPHFCNESMQNTCIVFGMKIDVKLNIPARISPKRERISFSQYFITTWWIIPNELKNKKWRYLAQSVLLLNRINVDQSEESSEWIIRCVNLHEVQWFYNVAVVLIFAKTHKLAAMNAFYFLLNKQIISVLVLCWHLPKSKIENLVALFSSLFIIQ